MIGVDHPEAHRSSRSYARLERRARRCEAKRVARERRLIQDAAPQILRALKSLLAIVDESRAVAGYHLSGEEAAWSDFPEVHVARAAVAAAEGR